MINMQGKGEWSRGYKEECGGPLVTVMWTPVILELSCLQFTLNRNTP